MVIPLAQIIPILFLQFPYYPIHVVAHSGVDSGPVFKTAWCRPKRHYTSGVPIGVTPAVRFDGHQGAATIASAGILSFLATSTNLAVSDLNADCAVRWGAFCVTLNWHLK